MVWRSVVWRWMLYTADGHSCHLQYQVSGRPMWRQFERPDHCLAFDGQAWNAQPESMLGESFGWIRLCDRKAMTPDTSIKLGDWEVRTGTVALLTLTCLCHTHLMEPVHAMVLCSQPDSRPNPTINAFLSHFDASAPAQNHSVPAIPSDPIRSNPCVLHKALNGPVLRPADSSSLLHVDCSPLCGFGMLVDTALERAAAELSNAISTTAWKARNGE